MKVPINVTTDEAGAKRIEKQEASWTAPKLIGLGGVFLTAALLALFLVSQCDVAPLPFP